MSTETMLGQARERRNDTAALLELQTQFAKLAGDRVTYAETHPDDTEGSGGELDRMTREIDDLDTKITALEKTLEKASDYQNAQAGARERLERQAGDARSRNASTEATRLVDLNTEIETSTRRKYELEAERETLLKTKPRNKKKIGETREELKIVKNRLETLLKERQERVGRVPVKETSSATSSPGVSPEPDMPPAASTNPERMPTPGEAQEIEAALIDVSKKDQEKVAWTLSNFGYKTEQLKNNFFAKTFDLIVETNLNRDSSVTKFCGELRDSFVRDSKRAEKSARDLAEKKAGTMKKVMNPVVFIGNVAKYGRLISDWTSRAISSPMRYVIMGGMIVARGADAAKETRLKGKEAITKTRKRKVAVGERDTEETLLKKESENAAEEAWKIYERAQQNTNDSSGINISAEALKSAYLRETPKDVLKRLEDTTVASGMVQSVIKKEIHFNVARLDKKISKIEKEEGLTLEQKEEKIERELKDWENLLKDYDRLITQVGELDTAATAGLYTQLIAKGVVTAVTIETVAISVEKLFGALANALTHETPIPGEGAAAHVGGTRDSTLFPKPRGAGEDVFRGQLNPAQGGSPQAGESAGGPTNEPAANVTGPAAPASAVAAGSAAPGAKVAEAVVKAAESKVENGLTHPANFEIGPKGLGDALRKLILDRTLPKGNLSANGIVLSHDDAARVLNEQTNFERILLEGRTTNGITVEQLRNAFTVEGNTIHVKNPQELYKIFDHFHQHSKSFVDDGTFKSADSAAGYVNNISRATWHQDIQGTNFHDTSAGAGTGILGRPEVTEDQVGDFSHIVRTQETGPSTTPDFTDLGPIDNQDIKIEEIKYPTINEADLIKDPTGGITFNNITEARLGNGIKINPNDFLGFYGTNQGTGPDAMHIIGDTPDAVNLTASVEHMSPELLKQVDEIFRDHVHHAFRDEPEINWDYVKDTPAYDLMNESVKEEQEGFVGYLKELQAYAGFGPKRGGLFTSPETTARFILRASKEIASKPNGIKILRDML